MFIKDKAKIECRVGGIKLEFERNLKRSQTTATVHYSIRPKVAY